jgi:hypothetical protein
VAEGDSVRLVDCLPGAVTGRLTIMAVGAPGSHGRCRRVIAACECGKVTATNSFSVATGVSSCGCLRFGGPQRARKHGGKGTAEYIAWKSMRRRCLNPANACDRKNYAGRGIVVCDRWNDYAAFLADMGPRPSPRHTIERVNNDRGYGPDNCKWATRLEQNRNKRNIVLNMHDAIDMVSLYAFGARPIDLARAFDVSPSAVHHVLAGSSWRLEAI